MRYLPTLWVALTIALPACKTAPQQDEAPKEVPLAWIVDAMPKAPVDAFDAMAKGAREQFETKFSCPTDRVALKRRTDLEAAPPTTSTPPDEVKADPGRYEKWKADQEQKQSLARASVSEHQKFEVTGCGHTQVVDCRPHHAHGAVYPNWADCSEIN